MTYSFLPLQPEHSQQILTWRYNPPYDLYDLTESGVSGFLNPDYRYHVVVDDSQDIVGYCCFGVDAQVPGGDYDKGEPDILDVGVGLRPDLTGKGHGFNFVSAILKFAEELYQPEIFRVTVAAFNLRSVKTFQKLGFKETGSFTRDMISLDFVQLERSARIDASG
jgi:RimJ/RimL family protein N-acetyltransferase